MDDMVAEWRQEKKAAQMAAKSKRKIVERIPVAKVCQLILSTFALLILSSLHRTITCVAWTSWHPARR